MKRAASCDRPRVHPAGVETGFSALPRLYVFSMAIASLSACAAVPPPETQIVIRELKIPVPVACVDPASVPIEPGAVILPLNDARGAADIAASQALKYKAYARELYALIVPACTATPR